MANLPKIALVRRNEFFAESALVLENDVVSLSSIIYFLTLASRYKITLISCLRDETKSLIIHLAPSRNHRHNRINAMLTNRLRYFPQQTKPVQYEHTR